MSPYEYVRRKIAKKRKYWQCSKCHKRFKKKDDGSMELIKMETLCEKCLERKR